MDTILVVNAGSSSVKFQVFSVTEKDGLNRLIKGQMDGIGVRPRLRGEGAAGKSLIDRSFEAREIADIPAAMQAAAAWLREGQNTKRSKSYAARIHQRPRWPVLTRKLPRSTRRHGA
jgi:acetate kinase